MCQRVIDPFIVCVWDFTHMNRTRMEFAFLNQFSKDLFFSPEFGVGGPHMDGVFLVYALSILI